MTAQFVTLTILGGLVLAAYLTTFAQSLREKCGPSLLPEGSAWPATSVAASP
ncbi:MAG: hypothetical protein KJO36_04360 [Acidimicrobiia bacterium]|nr:hypothetical protein [Acidimicrobiia bacterium]NNC42089.1 hypothetical protein [Acidimicrobiia bacterium]